MPCSIPLREAVPEDESTIRAVELDAARAYAAVPGHAFCLDLPARDAAEHARVRAEGVAFVGEIEGRLAGFLLIRPLDGHAHLLELAVALAYQRRGLGGRLIARGEAWARSQGYKEVTLTTFREVPWNEPYYRRLGYEIFEPTADRPEFRALLADEVAAGFTRTPRVAMRKRL